MTTISAKAILRSRSTVAPNKILSTLLLRYPRWIHAELRTHRQLRIEEGEEFCWEPSSPSLMHDPNLSRNASSSRAMPVKKLIDDVKNDPAVPLFWGANQKGMQAGEECNEKISFGDAILSREEAWNKAIFSAIRWAEKFSAAGYHKQIVNRLLEPFSHITVVVTATEWSNFLALRDHPDAEPHIRLLAQQIKKELDRTDNINDLKPGEWHLPFVTRAYFGEESTGRDIMLLIKKSVACCASTSYKTVDGFDMTFERAEALFDKLLHSDPMHASPFEHVARADSLRTNDGSWMNPELHANFVGFQQYRKMLTGECK